jgi:hypothetical protein
VLAAIGVGCLGVAATAQQAPPPQVPQEVAAADPARVENAVSQQAREAADGASAALPLPRGRPSSEAAPEAKGAAERVAAQARTAPVDAAPPERLRVPWLGIDTAVSRLGLDSRGALEVPRDADQIGWFEEGTAPGLRGAAVFTGHVDSTEGPGVLYNLAVLPEGAEIYVDRADGSELAFEVHHVAAYPKEQFPTASVYSSRGPTLRLVTCGGDWDDEARSYRDNVVAYARLVQDR